jgi:hypothetical protein
MHEELEDISFFYFSKINFDETELLRTKYNDIYDIMLTFVPRNIQQKNLYQF